MKKGSQIFIQVFILSLIFAVPTFAERIFFIAPDAGIVQEVLPEKLQKETWYPSGATVETFNTSYITYNIAYADSANIGFNDPSYPNRK